AEWVGVLGRDGALVPWREDPRAGGVLHLPRAAWRGARAGDVVVAVASEERRRRRPSERRPRGRGRPLPERPEGRVVEVLGPLGTPEADFRAIAWRHRLPVAFPEEVIAQVEAQEPIADPASLPGRLDLRGLPF